MMTGRLSKALLVTIVVAGWTATSIGIAADAGAVAAHAARSGRARGLVLSPTTGALVRSGVVRIAVRSGDQSRALTVHLNGVSLGGYFGLSRRGVRTLDASISQGLRRGRNVLRVRVSSFGQPVRTATVHFAVKNTGPLVGAGRDRLVVVGDLTSLRGRVLSLTGTPPRAPIHWQLLPQSGSTASASSATVSHPYELDAGFRATAPGEYTLRLIAGRGRAARSDSVTFSAVDPKRLIPIDTMVRQDGKPGISVDGRIYLAQPPADRRGIVQVLVLDRKTLGFISNTTYTDTDRLAAAVRALDPSQLVIAAFQEADEAGSAPIPGEAIAKALASIGFPKDDGPLPNIGGTISAIGVPGLDPGQANVNIDEHPDLETGVRHDGGRMTGYLTPDANLEFGFISPQRIPFDHLFNFGKSPAGCPPSGCDDVGFIVKDVDAKTLDVKATKFFSTDSRGLTASQQTMWANAMTAFLNQIVAGDLVGIETVSNPDADKSYRAPVGAIDRDAIVKLAAAVAKVGGTRNAFNSVARKSGPDSGVPVYSLLGWKGAAEGDGEEAAIGIDGAGQAPHLSGVLRRDLRYTFRPIQSSPFGAVPDPLSALVLEQPGTQPWPLDRDPGASRAVAYLGEHVGLSRDPRAQYWLQTYDQATWNEFATEVKESSYPGLASVDFTNKAFLEARGELVTELRWVAKVRGFLAVLSSPFVGQALKGWADAKTLADNIYNDVRKPSSITGLRWIQFTTILLKLLAVLPPPAGQIAATANLMDLGVWIAGANANGAPGGDELSFQADQIGDAIVRQALNAQQTYARLGDLIVSDYHKLKVVGTHAFCVRGDTSCPAGFSFDAEDKVEATTAISRAIERLAYEKLVPLGYHTFELNTSRQAVYGTDESRPPDIKHYQCRGYNAFKDVPALASTALLQELDPVDHRNAYQVFVLAVPPGAFDHYATAPPDKVLARMFDPVSDSNDPDAGGLGIQASELMRTAQHYSWDSGFNPGHEKCGFDG